MELFGWKDAPGYKAACVVDSLLAPALFAWWYGQNCAGVEVVVDGVRRRHAGLIGSGLMMILVGRAVLRLERALRSPESFTFDSVRAVRWYIILLAMALSIELLCR